MSARRAAGKRATMIAGWREWVALPSLGIDRIKAKLDTGARTSALHAFGIEPYERDGVRMVRFKVHPLQRDSRSVILVDAPLASRRTVRSSSGHSQQRLVIETEVELMGQRWTIEITLARRDEMGFRMLLGRGALKHRFLVDSGQSFLNERGFSNESAGAAP